MGQEFRSDLAEGFKASHEVRSPTGLTGTDGYTLNVDRVGSGCWRPQFLVMWPLESVLTAWQVASSRMRKQKSKEEGTIPQITAIVSY